jgi:hypothetical protein
VRIQASVPAQARVTTSSQPPPRTGQESATVAGGTTIWSGLALKNGEQLGPFSYRVTPVPGADGALIFRRASVQPDVTWTQPGASSAGRAPAPALRLNGLWGEGGLRRSCPAA